MTNKFEVQVVALDRFTNVFRKLNDTSSKAIRPLTNVQRQTGALFREMHLPEVVKGFTAASRAVQGFSTNLGAAAGPLQSLFGIGAAGSVLGAVAAAGALTASWARAGFEVNRTATAIGVSAADLQRWRGAAKLAGVSTEAMTGAMASLGQVLQDAAFGRNPQALMMLSKLGLNLRRDSQGVVDTVGTLNDLATALSKIADPQVRRVVASAFGLDEALPLLMQGPEKIRQLIAQVERLGGVMNGSALEGANKLTDSWNRLGVAATGLANRVAESIGMPGLFDALANKMAPSAGKPTFVSPNRPGWLFLKDYEKDYLASHGYMMPPDGIPSPRRSSGIVTDESGKPASGGLPRWGTQAFADMLQNDIRNGAQFSPGVLERLTQKPGGEPIELKVTVHGASSATVTARQGSAPVRVAHSMATD